MSQGQTRRSGPGVPIKIPSQDDMQLQDITPRRPAAGRKSIKGSMPFQPGRDTIDTPRGSKSLVTPRSKGATAQVQPISQGSFYSHDKRSPNVSTFANGAGSLPPQQRGRTLTLQSERDTSASYRPQNRDATASQRLESGQQNKKKFPSFGTATSYPFNTPIRQGGVRTRADKAALNDRVPIELTDSEDSDSEKRRASAKGKERAILPTSSSSSLSPPIENSPTLNGSRKVQSSEDAISSAAGKVVNFASQSTERAPTASSSSPLSSVNAVLDPPLPPTRELPPDRAFRIASYDDGKSLRAPVSQRMKDKNGHVRSLQLNKPATKSMLPNDQLYRSTFRERSRRVATDILVDLDCLGFLDMGYYGYNSRPKVTMTPPNSMKLEWKADKASGVVGRPDGNGKMAVSFDLRDVDEISVLPANSSFHAEHGKLIRMKVSSRSKIYSAFRNAVIPQGMKSRPIDIVLSRGRAADDKTSNSWNALEEELRSRATTMQNKDYLALRDRLRSSAELPDAIYDRLFESDDNASTETKLQKERPKPRPSARTAQNDAEPMRSVSSSRAKSPSPKKLEEFPRQVLRYPIVGPHAVTIFQSDVDKLEEGEFLNDTIIEFGLKYLLANIQERDPELHEQIYVFSSFFYKRFTERRESFRISYDLVKKWTSKVHLFRKKYLVVPINENLHWYLAIIVNPLLAFPEEVRAAQANSIPVKGSAGDFVEQVNVRKDERETSSKYSSPELSDTADDRDTPMETADDSASGSHSTVNERAVVTETFQDVEGDTVMDESLGAPSTQVRSVVVPVDDRRSTRDGLQISKSNVGPSDGIFNEGQGTLLGGGEKSAGTRIFPGATFSNTTRNDDRDEAGYEEVRFSKRLRGRDSISLQSTSSRQTSPRPSLSRRSSLAGPSEHSNRTLRSSGVGASEHIAIGSPFTSSSERPNVAEKRRDWLENGATVLVFDSLHGRHKPVQTSMKNYLSFEMEDKCGHRVPPSEVKLEYIEVAMPKQNNFADCGLYLLHSFDRFFSDADLFKSDIIPTRNAEHPQWCASQALERRKWCRSLLTELANAWKAEQQRRLQARSQEKEKQQRQTEAEDVMAAAVEDEVDENDDGSENVPATIVGKRAEEDDAKRAESSRDESLTGSYETSSTLDRVHIHSREIAKLTSMRPRRESD